MPCYLFTFHAYRSWLPDRKQGYTRKKKGYLPRDPKAAEQYRRNAKEGPVEFTDAMQKAMIEEVQIAAKHQQFRVHSIGNDPPHNHDLVSWRDGRDWGAIRRGIKSSLTRRLNREFGKRTWFVDGASRKRVRDRRHFDYLTITHLPDHPGWKWSPEKGLYL